MDRKGLEIAKFLLDWHYLLTEPPVDGSIPEIYFCFVCSVYSKGKDKVSWLQFIKYLRIINNMCSGNTLVCVPNNALDKHYDDPFRCFDRIIFINRLSLALLLRTSQSLSYNTNYASPVSSSGSDTIRDRASSPETENNNGGTNESTSPTFSITRSAKSPSSSSFSPLSSPTSSIGDDETSLILDNFEFEYKRKNIEEIETSEIPKNKEEKLKFVLDLIEGEKPQVSENDIYPIKMITNKKLIPRDINDTYTLTTRASRLEQLDYLLSTPCSSHSLQRERARLRTKVHPFFDCCEDEEHATMLGSLISFDKNTSYSKLNEEKMRKMIYENNKYNSGSNKFQLLYKCVENKLHFIPIIQSQTDFKLGDCSYLDTCHKMSTCRYIHYGQLMPLKFNEKKNKPNSMEFDKELFEINENIRIWDFTRGESICSYLKCELPAQWINCDLMKIDFDVFGNDFGVVIADPSWTIHMNLNYSSLKDDELLGLRMDKLQREGLFLLWVTGRTIETGREFLNRWGYKVVNQITWIKTSQLVRTISTGRTGHWLNHSKEHLLVGIKGDIKWLNKGIDAQILISSTRETSRKPDEIYGIVDRMVGQGVNKLEIFGRQHNTRSGWLTVGNQLDGVHIVERALVERYAKYRETVDAKLTSQ